MEESGLHEQVDGCSSEEMQEMGGVRLKFPARLGKDQEGRPVTDAARPADETPHPGQQVSQGEPYNRSTATRFMGRPNTHIVLYLR